MGRANPDILRSLGYQIRSQMEKLQADHGCWFGDLSGMCAIASFYLFRLLKKNGYKPAFAINEGHAFVVCGGYVVDVTATQFDQKRRVVVRLLSNIDSNKHSFWQIDEKHYSEAMIQKALSSWPSDQKPNFVKQLSRKRA